MWFRGRGKADRAIAAYQRELVDTHYREVENMYRQMRMWRHDYRNHLQTMKALDTPIKSGNAMADVILSSKMSLAQAHGIDVRVDAHIPHFGTRFVLRPRQPVRQRDRGQRRVA